MSLLRSRNRPGTHGQPRRISARQIARICNAAQEFCGGLPSGLLTAMRNDAALVDQFGRVEIVENAFGVN